MLSLKIILKIKTTKYLNLIILFLLVQYTCGQKKSNYAKYSRSISKKIYLNNYTILYYSKKLEQSKDSCIIYNEINFEAKAKYLEGDYKTAEQKSLQVLEDLQKTKKNCLIVTKSNALTRLFWIYKNKKQYNKAYQTAIKRKKVIRGFGRNHILSDINTISAEINLAIIKDILGFHEVSRAVYKRAIESLPETYQKLIEKKYYTNTEEAKYFMLRNQSAFLNLLGESYLNYHKSFDSNDLDSASFYFKKAYDIAKQFDPKHENTETLFQLREANVLVARGEYEKSLEVINKYSKNQKKFNTSQNINSLKTICFHNLNNSDSALVYAKKYLKNYRSKEINKRKLITIYDILANQYHIKQKLDSAFKYSELTLNEIKILEKNKNSVNKTHFLYNKKNIEDLNKKILEKERFDYQKLIGFIIIFTLLIIVFFVRKSKKITTHLSKVEKFDQQKVNPTAKKEYNINIEIEDAILQGLKDLKNSSNFLKSDFNIKILADELNTNTTYISYVINKKFQKSFKEYLTEIRIEYLINKLEKEKDHKKYTIKFLGEQIGYTNASAFTRAFKKYKGITPSEFIKNLG